jgi:hypothetical protein
MKKSNPVREKQFELNSILKAHDIQKMRNFILGNKKEFPDVTECQILSDRWCYDVMHIYKANLIYMGSLFYESVDYCLANGLIEISADYAAMLEQARKNPEVLQECFITQALDQGQLPEKS